MALAQGEPSRALELFKRSRDISAALGLSGEVAEEEEMIERARAMLPFMDRDEGAGL